MPLFVDGEFRQYRRREISEMRPYIPGEPMDGVRISPLAVKAGSPKEGDAIGRNPADHAERWFVPAWHFAQFEECATDEQ